MQKSQVRDCFRRRQRWCLFQIYSYHPQLGNKLFVFGAAEKIHYFEVRQRLATQSAVAMQQSCVPLTAWCLSYVRSSVYTLLLRRVIGAYKQATMTAFDLVPHPKQWHASRIYQHKERFKFSMLGSALLSSTLSRGPYQRHKDLNFEHSTNRRGPHVTLLLDVIFQFILSTDANPQNKLLCTQRTSPILKRRRKRAAKVYSDLVTPTSLHTQPEPPPELATPCCRHSPVDSGASFSPPSVPVSPPPHHCGH